MKKPDSYDPQKIEMKWQKKWAETKVYSPDLKKAEKPFYNLMMFPYPSAEGLHAGNMFAFTGSDVFGRFKRMNGYDVFEPIGLDGFGIHSENYALKIGRSPIENAAITEKNYYRQLHEIGDGFDWDHKLETYSLDYYRWTQWLFVEMFKAGLAYKKKAFVNFCPFDKTVLADEQVMTPKQAGKEPHLADGTPVKPEEGLMVCERCGTVIEKKELEQWFFRITDYADKLLSNLDKINWSERVVKAQKEWIGKKDGINIIYKIVGFEETITVFTTTPVNFGATFLVVAPEYAKSNLLELIPKPNQETVSKYINRSLKESLEKRKEEKNKTGVFTGLYVTNHVTKKNIPVWISDFVLIEVGTGAVQGCPGHDLRDFQFAKQFGIPIKRVVVGENGDESDIDSVEKIIEKGDKGRMINSDFLDGMSFDKAMEKTKDYFEEKGWGKRVNTYHLRDWLISRQRYWGPPIPMIYCKSCGQKNKSWFRSHKPTLHANQSDWNDAGWYPDDNLPVRLPDIKDYKPEGSGRGPLANHKEFYEVKCPECGSPATRETDVSDTFLDSSWYFLRYPSTDSKDVAFDPELTKKWLPVSLYFGGAEHSVLHLMYSRFTWMVLRNLGYLDFSTKDGSGSGWDEPFPNFYAHGLVIKDGAKMSKSRGNVVNPDEYIEKFGADTLRTYLMFMGPMDSYPDFRDTGIEGMHRFIKRAWVLCHTNPPVLTEKSEEELKIKVNQTIQKVTKDIEVFHYNTAISAIMEFVNFLYDSKKSVESQHAEQLARRSADSEGAKIWFQALHVLCQLLAPFAPHITEEIWVEVLGNKYSIHTSKWPKYDPKYTKVHQAIIIVQVNGRMRSQIIVSENESADQKSITALAEGDKKLQKWIDDKEYKVIFVPGKIINFVTANAKD